MKESDVFHLIGSLANGQVYMDIVPLNDAGKPAVVPPWITFTFVSQSYGDTFCSPAEETTFVQVDVYSRSVEESRNSGSRLSSLLHRCSLPACLKRAATNLIQNCGGQRWNFGSAVSKNPS
jgi:hypothetical protein